jgi:signal transduction histidine kinase
MTNIDMRMTYENSQKLMDSRKQFVRYISHEIRTPLNVVHAGLQLLNSYERNRSEEERESFADMTNACSVAIGILNDLLLFDKLQEGELPMELQNTPARSFLVSTASIFAVQVLFHVVCFHCIILSCSFSGKK